MQESEKPDSAEAPGENGASRRSYLSLLGIGSLALGSGSASARKGNRRNTNQNTRSASQRKYPPGIH